MTPSSGWAHWGESALGPRFLAQSPKRHTFPDQRIIALLPYPRRYILRLMADDLLTTPEDGYIIPQRDEVEKTLAELSSIPKLPRELRTRNTRLQFQQAFELIGGIPRLALWANDNYDKFIALYSKLIPVQVTGEGGGPVQIQLSWLNARDTTGKRSPPAVIDVQEVK